MKPKTAERLRVLAEACVSAAHRTSDEDAAVTFLDLASSLVDLANGKADSQKVFEPVLN